MIVKVSKEEADKLLDEMRQYRNGANWWHMEMLSRSRW